MENGIEDALNKGFTEPIRDALWGHIYLTPELERITRSSAFIRLHHIAQLGPTSLCYPGATHTRAAHSLGVYHLTRRLLLALCERGASGWLSFRGIRSMLCAALLHDVGHFPYAHSLKELPLSSHEELSSVLIRGEELCALIDGAGGDPGMTAAIIDGGAGDGGDTEIIFYRKLLSGCLDPDKLDYLNRDARYCGVPYGAQDIDFIFSMLYPHPERGVEIDERGIPNVEAILFSKYMMYRSVYWHHSVRCATAMVKKAVLAGLIEGSLRPLDLYNLTDTELFNLMSAMRERGHGLFGIGIRAYRGRLFSLAAEFPLTNEAQARLGGIQNRPLCEKNLAAALSSETGTQIDSGSLIIDVPELFSFETALFIRGRNRVFDESASFFSGKTARDCEKSMRVVRVFIDDAKYDRRLKGRRITRIFTKAISNKE